MEVVFLLKCFLIGVLAASGCGPIFVLTFNRAAICGFFKGFATALGASFGDSFYFLLALLGALAVIGEMKFFMIFLDLIGGILLVSLGIHSIKKMKQVFCVAVECSYSHFLSVGKAFVLTVFNPLVILFFMAVAIQILPDNMQSFSTSFVLLSSFFVFLGSLFVLTTVSLIASYLGSCITAKKLKFISAITGIVFIIFGVYLFSDFAISLAKVFLIT